jgi:hypothetical protein
MVMWTDVDKNLIEIVPGLKDRIKFKYQGGPLRFQIPRGMCTWGVSAYKSFQVDLSNQEFMTWWRDLETQLCSQEPFNSNLKINQSGTPSLRLKIDEATYIFDKNSKQVTPEIKEGLFRVQEVSCLVDVESTYFFNGTWGLTCRASQVRFYSEETAPEPTFSLKGCAFLPTDDA